MAFSYEKQYRTAFISQEKEALYLKSKAQIPDLFPSPLFIISRNSLILYSNCQANQILEENPTKLLLSLISKRDYAIFESNLAEILMHDPPKTIKLEFMNNSIWEANFQSIFWEKAPAIILILYQNKTNESMMKSFSMINKRLSKMASNLLENMETDYNKWSNLQSLKYIKQSDMKLLASCVMESNYLKCLIHANLDKTKMLLSHSQIITKPKHIIFNLKNTILHILEIISVQAIPKHQEIALKFEDSFPEKVAGDINRFKQGLLILWRQISMSYSEHETFQMDCRLKEFNKNSHFILIFLIILPENPEFFELLAKVSEDQESLSYNIHNQVFESFDILMFKPIMSLLSAKIHFQPEIRTFSIEMPLEPAGELEAKNGILFNKTPFLLTFCRTNPDKNVYKWKEVIYVINEKEKPRLLQKFKKVTINKELPKLIAGQTSSSNEENENPIPIQHPSSKEISEKASSKEESPELDYRPRKKSPSCFSKDVFKEISSAGSGHMSLLEESKGERESVTEFMTPLHNNKPNRDIRIKALIQEDLRDVEHSSSKLKPIKEFKMNGVGLNKEIGKEEKKQVFDRGIYESLFKCWKINEKNVKRMLMSSIYKILEKNKQNVELKFSKGKNGETEKKRQKSLPIIPTSFTSLNLNLKSQKNYSQTPQWSSRQLKSRMLKNCKISEENKIEFIEQEKMAFLGTRMILSPRADFFKKVGMNSFMSPALKPMKNFPFMNEVLKSRCYTVRRRWLANFHN